MAEIGRRGGIATRLQTLAELRQTPEAPNQIEEVRLSNRLSELKEPVEKKVGTCNLQGRGKPGYLRVRFELPPGKETSLKIIQLLRNWCKKLIQKEIQIAYEAGYYQGYEDAQYDQSSWNKSRAH